MKERKKSLKFSFCLIALLIVIAVRTIIYAQVNSQTQEILNTPEYILQNINPQYASANKLDVVDILAVKQTFADGTKLTSGESLQAMYSDTPDAFILMDEFYVAMYDTDENSNYYVAFANTMHDDNTRISEVDFAYTNLEGEAITDAIYDNETGLVYIPKKYTQENKNGLGVMNVQVQFLQIADNNLPDIKIQTLVENDNTIDGNVISTGELTYKVTDSKIEIPVALDDTARKNINGRNIVIEKNGFVTTDYTYNSTTGVVTFEGTPSSVDTLKISISQNNDAQIQEVQSEDSGFEYNSVSLDRKGAKAVPDGAQSFDTAVSGTTVWKASDDPSVGDTIRISTNDMTLVYHAGDDNRQLEDQDNPAYAINHALGSDMAAVVNAIKDNTNLSYDNLVSATWYMSWECIFEEDVNINVGGVELTIPRSTYNLKCAHGTQSFDTITGSTTRTHEIELKIFDVDTEKKHILVGMLAPYSHSQSGAGLFVVTYETEPKKGALNLWKKEEDNALGFHDIIEGATFHITGPNFDTYWTSEAGVTKNYPDLEPGQYTITEVSAPANMYARQTEYTVTINANETSSVEVTNIYQKGSVTLTKYDADSVVPRGSCSLEGAIYELYAAETIKEGTHTVYNADQLVRGNIVTKADGTTDAVTDLPVGKYYYVERKASTGFKLNGDRVNAEVKGNSLTSRDAQNDSVRAPEDEIEVNLRLHKKLTKTDYEKEIDLANCRFTATYVKELNNDGTVKTLDNSQVYTSTLTGNDGIATINNIPYGIYLIHETEYPDEALPADDFIVDFTEATGAYDGKLYDFEVKDPSKTIQIAVDKMIPIVFKDKTDAEVSGAVFTVYLDAECTQPFINEFTGEEVKIGPTNDDGYAISGEMRTRNYWIKETTFPEHMESKIVNPHATDFGNPEGTTYENMKYAVEESNETQTVKNVINTKNIENKPFTGKVMLVKYDDEDVITDESLPAGAKVRLTLDSNPETYYDIVVDRYGYIEFENQQVKEMYYSGKEQKDCFTIPYGVYTLSEVKESDSGSNKDWYFQNKKVQAFSEDGVYPIIEADIDVKLMLNIVKKDADTNAQVILPEAGYMIYSLETDNFVEQKVHDGADNAPINVFYTNNQGHLKLPEAIPAGEYVLYEVKAPKGYYLDDNLRLPYKDNNNQINTSSQERITYIEKDNPLIDQSKLGNTEFGGQLVPATKENLELSRDAEYPTNPLDEYQYALDNLVYTAEVTNTPLTFQIELYKTGDMYTDVEETTYNQDGVTETIKAPKYTKEGLNGVTFKITALEDIKSEDGTQTYRNAGWSTTMTTGENGQADGYALSEELYNGKYKVEEIVTPVGYQKCDAFEVDEHNYDQYTEVLQVSKTADNVYQTVEIPLKKIFEYKMEGDYPIYLAEGETMEDKTKDAYAIFGLFANQDLTTINGNKTIRKGDIVAIVKATSNQIAKVEAKLPDGEYYFEELTVTSPFMESDDKYPVTVDHRRVSNEEEVLEVGEVEVVNDVTGGDFVFLKVSTSDILFKYGIVTISDEIDKTHARELLQQYTDEMNRLIENGETDVYTIAKNLHDEGIKLLSTAEYELYADEALTKHIMVSENGEPFKNVVITSEKESENDEDYAGIYRIKGLPDGEYYLKETKAPIYVDIYGTVHKYEVDETPIPVYINNADVVDNYVAFKMISDVAGRTPVQKVDILTAEPVPNCKFKILDENQKPIAFFETTGEGFADIYTDIFRDGGTYYFVEYEAADKNFYFDGQLYELNTEPHKFEAHVGEDGKWYFTHEKVKHDSEGNEITEEEELTTLYNYRPVVDVKFIKTDEQGNLVPNCKFELKSRDGDYYYETGVTDENGIYVFEDVPQGWYIYTELEAPSDYNLDTTPHEVYVTGTEMVITFVNTGDIAVYAISVVAVLSVLGIAFIIIRNNKRKIRE